MYLQWVAHMQMLFMHSTVPICQYTFWDYILRRGFSWVQFVRVPIEKRNYCYPGFKLVVPLMTGAFATRRHENTALPGRAGGIEGSPDLWLSNGCKFACNLGGHPSLWPVIHKMDWKASWSLWRMPWDELSVLWSLSYLIYCGLLCCYRIFVNVRDRKSGLPMTHTENVKVNSGNLSLTPCSF